MSNVRIVTDSTADIPQTVREALGIEFVPLKVHFGEETYLDAVTIKSEDFYGKLAQAEQLPTTSQPSPVDFLDKYKQLADTPEAEIISIHLSAALSGTYQSAVLAKSLLEEKVNVTIVNSKSASYGLGMLAVEAAKSAQAGKSKEECLNLIRQLREQTKLYFLVDTLEYLQKGGRIGKAAALFGSLLNIKPILTVDSEGEIAPVDKVRGNKKAVGRIVELLKQDFPDRKVNAVVAHSNALAAAEEFGEVLRQHFNIQDLSFTSIGPVIGTHVGPGTTAVFMHPAE
jgi:DegV family protein with EDD domain